MQKKVSIVIPTYNEAGNIPILLSRIKKALDSSSHVKEYEIIIVDDNSPDGTAITALRKAAELGIKDRVKVYVRKNERGLSTAVLKGIRESSGEIIVVMDADLQHPPEKIPEMVEPILEGKAEISVATRYRGGREKGLSLPRKIVSKTASLIAKLLLPQTRMLSDPMTGFFAFHRKVVSSTKRKFEPKGYKILLEILVKGEYDPHKIIEIPYVFERRYSGESKLGLKETLEYIEHILKLNEYRVIKFAGVGASGILVNEGLLSLLYGKIGFPLWVAGALAIESSILSNFTLNSLITFKNVSTGTTLFQKLFRYHLATALGVAINYIVLLGLSYLAEINPLISNLIGILLGFTANYLLSEHYVWKRKGL